MPNNPKVNIIYSNHILQAPDGSPISRIGADRSEWYLERGLAHVVCDEPYTIRLNFEPAGRGHEGDNYYMADKENHCVVCGQKEDINKHHVIPRLYRKHMPEEYKDRTSHDVVILCVDCHTKYEVEADKRKRQIAQELGFLEATRKLHDMPPEKIREVQARKGAGALLRHRDTIPPARIQQIEEFVREFVPDLDPDKMGEFVFQTKHYMSNYMGDEMAKHVLARCNIQEFGLGWRRHFVEVMNPQHLPAGWSVDRPLSRAS